MSEWVGWFCLFGKEFVVYGELVKIYLVSWLFKEGIDLQVGYWLNVYRRSYYRIDGWVG
jgi:hypothetical protein